MYKIAELSFRQNKTTHRVERIMVQKSTDLLTQFETGKYVSIITYTKSEKEIATPVWFVSHLPKLYIATPKTTYKIRRITNDARVKFALCSRKGEVRGIYLRGNARILHPEEDQAVSQLFKLKYGFLFKIWSANVKNLFRNMSRKENRLNFVEITPIE